MIEDFVPGTLHIATERPLGFAARSRVRQRSFAFTTAFRGWFAEYINARTHLPVRPIYPWMPRFHATGQSTIVATANLRDELTRRGSVTSRPGHTGSICRCSAPATQGSVQR